MSMLLASAQTTGSSGGFVGMIIYLVVFVFLMWLIAVRPQKKKEKEIAEMQNSIKIGDEVLLQSGAYGKVVDVINDVLIIEFGLNKAVRIPVKKVAVAAIQSPNLSRSKSDSKTDSKAESKLDKQPKPGTRVVEDGVEYEYVEVEEEVEVEE